MRAVPTASQNKSEKIKRRISQAILVILVMIIPIIVLIEGGGEWLSRILEVPELYFCTPDPLNAENYLPVGEISLSNPPEQLYICGNAVTDGRRAGIVIVLYHNKELITDLAYQQDFVIGYFAFPVSNKHFNKPGVYTAKASFARIVINEAVLEVKP